MSELVGRKVPYFNVHAKINGGDVEANFSLDQYVEKKHVVFFFYPKDYLPLVMKATYFELDS